MELPGEDHHYSGREPMLHAAWEMIEWLDRMMPAVDGTPEVVGTD